MSAQELGAHEQYLSFTLAGGDYAVAILQVKEILQFNGATLVPGLPPSIRGVINLRGAVVPVLDLAVKLGLPPIATTARTCVLIVEATLEGERKVMGVLADSVREVLDLSRADVQPPPSFGTQVRLEFLVGMARVGSGFALLLDLDRVISASEREVAGLVEAAAEAAAPPPAEAALAGAQAEVAR